MTAEEDAPAPSFSGLRLMLERGWVAGGGSAPFREKRFGRVACRVTVRRRRVSVLVCGMVPSDVR